MHFDNMVQESEFEEKEVIITSKELFKDDLKFSNDFLLNSKKGGKP